jgi:ATP-dependent Clp protease ATP-binding subunit ClpA
LLNRIDEQIVFDHLSEEAIHAIARLRVRALQARLLKERGIEIEVADDAVSLLARLGYDERSGARELNRVVERLLEEPLSEKILAGELRNGARVVVRGGDNELWFEE